jgi:predicted phosphoribosyltransferase
VYRGSSLLADLNFQAVSVLYENFTRVSPNEFEILIHLIGKKSRKSLERSGKPFMFKKGWH